MTSVRYVVVCTLPGAVPAICSASLAVVEAMTDNPYFPTPKPPLATVRLNIGELEKAEAATKTRAKRSDTATTSE